MGTKDYHLCTEVHRQQRSTVCFGEPLPNPTYLQNTRICCSLEEGKAHRKCLFFFSLFLIISRQSPRGQVTESKVGFLGRGGLVVPRAACPAFQPPGFSICGFCISASLSVLLFNLILLCSCTAEINYSKDNLYATTVNGEIHRIARHK